MVPLAANSPKSIFDAFYFGNKNMFSFDGKTFGDLPISPKSNHYEAGGIPSYDGNPLAVGDKDHKKVEIFRGDKWEYVADYPTGYVLN